MFEKIRKMKNQKGFTLVELIVVLVILAILAAMLVPALTGYIDKANDEKIIAATRQVVMAAQTEVSEAYASKKLEKTKIVISNDGTMTYNGTALASGTTANVAGDDIIKLAEVAKIDSSTSSITGLKNGISAIEITYTAEGHVSQVKLTQGKKTCTYYEGEDGKTNGAYDIGTV